MRALLPAVLALLGLALANRLLLRRRGLLPPPCGTLREALVVALASAFVLLLALGFVVLLGPPLWALGLPWPGMLPWLLAVLLALPAGGMLLHRALAGSAPARPLLAVAGGNALAMGLVVHGAAMPAGTVEILWLGFALGLGFGLWLLLLSALDLRLAESEVPAPLRGVPVLLLAAATLALAAWTGLGGTGRP